MPKSTFQKLPIEKQNAILTAAKKEFSQKKLKDASINQIIKDAHIPRGSFYMYFEDIEDLYQYFLEEFNQKAYDYIGYLFEKLNGNIHQAFLEYFDRALEVCSKKENQALFHNVFWNMNLYMEEKRKAPIEKERIEFLIQKIDTSHYCTAARRNLFFVYHLFLKETIFHIVQVIHFNVHREQSKKELEEKFWLLENGLNKEEKENV